MNPATNPVKKWLSTLLASSQLNFSSVRRARAVYCTDSNDVTKLDDDKAFVALPVIESRQSHCYFELCRTAKNSLDLTLAHPHLKAFEILSRDPRRGRRPKDQEANRPNN